MRLTKYDWLELGVILLPIFCLLGLITWIDWPTGIACAAISPVLVWLACWLDR